MTAKAEQKSFTAADETRTFERGALDLLRIGGAEIGRLTLQPGWRWSDHVKPLAGTELCEAPHFQYHVQGVLHVVMADGSEFDAPFGQLGSLLRAAKLAQCGVKPPHTPRLASIFSCRSPARPCSCWMVSVHSQNRVRPLPMFPPLGEIGVGPLMVMSALPKKSSASPSLMP